MNIYNRYGIPLQIETAAAGNFVALPDHTVPLEQWDTEQLVRLGRLNVLATHFSMVFGETPNGTLIDRRAIIAATIDYHRLRPTIYEASEPAAALTAG